MFDVYRCQPEVTFAVPALACGDPPLRIRLAAAGGGTVGAAYAHNDWLYEVQLDGVVVCSGADLRSGGAARTHTQMAAALAGFLADAGSVAALRPHRDRLACWAAEVEHRSGGG